MNPETSPLLDRNAHRGFTLVEVLVGLVVLSVGILGVSKLMFASMKVNDDAAFRSRTTFAATTILEAMRANLSASIQNGYAVTSLAS